MNGFKVPMLSLVREVMPYNPICVNTHSDIERILKPIKASKTERFMVLLVNYASGKIIVTGMTQQTDGESSSSKVDIRGVFNVALSAGADAIIVAHNHPNGDKNPSDEDIKLTARLVHAGIVIGIPVLDHFIIPSKGKIVSIREIHEQLWEGVVDLVQTMLGMGTHGN